ncbi:MAG: mechanosensitive ion channel family protein [Desulfobacterales bacterium]
MEELTKIQEVVNIIIDFCVRYSFQILGALIILGIGIYLAGWLSRMVVRLCEKRTGCDAFPFSRSGGSPGGFGFVVIMAMGKFGISVAPLIAALGALAFGASFALQGPLSNYGAGLVIIMTRPFVVGDTVTIEGVSGVVEEVTLATTILSTEDGEKITIPNKNIVGEIQTNSFENKVVEASVGISYDDDPEKAIDIIREILLSMEKIPKTPAPQIGIEEYADSAISIGMRYWVPTKSYYETMYAVNLAVFKKFKEAGITIPFPQRDVHMINKIA